MYRVGYILSNSTLYKHTHHFSNYTDDGRYPIKNKLHLFAALSEVGNWESLCTNLGVSDSLMEALRFSDKNNMLKKEECLKHFYNDDPDWGHVVNTVAEFPISNPTLACKIAKKFMDMDKKECRAFLGERDDDEL